MTNNIIIARQFIQTGGQFNIGPSWPDVMQMNPGHLRHRN